MNEKGSYVTSVRLCERSRKIAKQLPNLSAFVRECILYEAGRWQIGDHVQPAMMDSIGVCNPMSNMGCCPLCWPDGKPLQREWKDYFYGIQTGDLDVNDLSIRPQGQYGHLKAGKHFGHLARADEPSDEESYQTTLNNWQNTSQSRGKRGIFTRIWRFFI
tara:strand:+ start:26 stop:505 length:480 start_codon:yes stop_codon:yes gene_type:complete